MRIESIQVGSAREIPVEGSGAWWDKPWKSGFIKSRVAGPIWIDVEGLRGDEQADRRVHGGPDKAACAYPAERYAQWAERLLERAPGTAPVGGVALGAAAFGENLTLSGMLEPDVCVGDVYSVGEALLEVSQPRQPCWKLARRWRQKDLAAEVERTGWTGYYFRVKRAGWIEAGQALALLDRPYPEWTIERCNIVMRERVRDRAAAAALAAIPALSRSWRDGLQSEIHVGRSADPPSSSTAQPLNRSTV